MSDIAKIRGEIAALTIYAPFDSYDSVHNSTVRTCLYIIDKHLAAERKSRGEWVHECDRDGTCWFLVNRSFADTKAEIRVAVDGLFSWHVFQTMDGGKSKAGVSFPTFKAAQLAAEKAMEKMEGER